VYVDGEHHSTLRGDDIVAQFIEILEAYVLRRFGTGTEVAT
jgi:(E)-4-hydroxy-3-methylbut-2-enyl-diphosphate synthase